MRITALYDYSLVQAPKHKPKPQTHNKTLLPFRLFTLPKSGTHLTEAILKQLGYTKMGPPHHFFYDEKVDFRGLDPQVRYIAQIRDPRDIMVSLVHHIDKGFNLRIKKGGNTDPNFTANRAKMRDWVENKTFGEKLMKVIECDNSIGYRVSWVILSQFKEAQQLLKMRKLPRNITLIRFEDLIGSKGGGNDVAQRQTIQKIANHLKIPITDAQAKEIADNAWGHSKTFRKGQIGQWKECFQPEHIEAFRNRWNPFLMRFGYETNAEWYKEFLNPETSSADLAS